MEPGHGQFKELPRWLQYTARIENRWTKWSLEMLLVLPFLWFWEAMGFTLGPGSLLWASHRPKHAWHLPLCLLPTVPMHVWNAPLKNHDVGWKLQWVWGQQPGRVPEKPYSDRRRKARQNSGPPGPEQWIQLLQEEGASEGPGGSSHLPEHPRHRQILPADIPSFLHIFQLNLLVSVSLGALRLCLGKGTDISGVWPAAHTWTCWAWPLTDQSSSPWTTSSSILAPGGAQGPSSCPPPGLVGLLTVHAVLCPTSCRSGTVFFCSCVWTGSWEPPSNKKRLKCLPDECSETLMKPRIQL